MSKNLKLYLLCTVTLGLSSNINLGIVTMFFKNKSLSYFEVSLLFSMILFSSLILEYPSGILADKYGRKKVYSIGLFSIAVKYLLYGLSSNFVLLSLAAICSGVGGALISGSLRAWLIIEERKNGNTELKSFFARVVVIKNIISIIVSLMIVFVNGRFNQIFFVNGIVLLLLCIIASTSLNDNYGEKKSISEYNRHTIKLFFSEKIYLIITLLFTVQVSLYSIFILYWPAKLISLKIDHKYTTIFYCAYLIGAVMMNTLMPLLTKKISRMKYIGICIIFMTTSFIILGSQTNFVILIGMFIFGIGYGSLNPVFFGWLAKHIDENSSAALISMITAIGSILSIIINIIIGEVMDRYPLYIIQGISILLGIISCIVILFVSKKITKVGIDKDSISKKII